jgi:magnesium transporter
MFLSRLRKKHSRTPAPEPGAPVSSAAPPVDPRLRFTRYDQARFEERIVTAVEQIPPQADGSVLWVELDGIGDGVLLGQLATRFNLHPLAIEDAQHSRQRPKVEPYEGHLFVILQMVYLDTANELCIEQVSVFIGPDFVLSVQEESLRDTFNPVRERIRHSRGLIRKCGPDHLAYALTDSIIDNHFPILERLGDHIEELDSVVISEPSPDHIHRLHGCKQTLSQLRRFVWPERDVINALLHDESGLVRRETKVFLRDCYDHTVQIMDLIEAYRDSVTSLMELYLSSVGIRTNEIMRVLTVLSAIFSPLTFLAGIWGMNFQKESDGIALPFNMPELHWRFGYLSSLAIMTLIAVAQIYYFKKKKWF